MCHRGRRGMPPTCAGPARGPDTPWHSRAMEPPPPGDQRRVIRFDIVNTVLTVLFVVLALWLVQALWNVVVVVLVALIIVGAVLPIVHYFERHGIKRSIALALTYVGAFVVLTGLLFLTLPPLV